MVRSKNLNIHRLNPKPVSVKRKATSRVQRTSLQRNHKTQARSSEQNQVPSTSKVPEKRLENKVVMKLQKPRARPGVKALRQIRQLQKSVNLVIPKAPFARLVREMMMGFALTDMRVESLALEALQEAAELYLIQLLEDSYCCAIHARRSTVLNRDIQLVRMLRGHWNLNFL